MGGKCLGVVVYVLIIDSLNLNVIFIRNGFEKIVKIKVFIN